MLNVWKKNIHWKFFGKTCLSSKSPSGNVESLSDNSPDNFPPKNRFIHKIVKPPPPAPAPVLKKTIKLNIFQGIKFFQEQCIWTDKDTFLTICFRSSKNICRKSRKCLEDIHSIKKKHLPEKTLQVFTIHFWQSCWSFSKILRDFVPKFYENTLLDFQKNIQLLIISQVKKIAMKKKLL